MSTTEDGTDGGSGLIALLEKEIERRRLSVDEAAAEIGVTGQAIRNWQEGTKSPRAGSVRKIEGWLERTPAPSEGYAEGYRQALQDVRQAVDALENRLPTAAPVTPQERAARGRRVREGPGDGAGRRKDRAG